MNLHAPEPSREQMEKLGALFRELSKIPNIFDPVKVAFRTLHQCVMAQRGRIEIDTEPGNEAIRVYEQGGSPCILRLTEAIDAEDISMIRAGSRGMMEAVGQESTNPQQAKYLVVLQTLRVALAGETKARQG